MADFSKLLNIFKKAEPEIKSGVDFTKLGKELKQEAMIKDWAKSKGLPYRESVSPYYETEPAFISPETKALDEQSHAKWEQNRQNDIAENLKKRKEYEDLGDTDPVIDQNEEITKTKTDPVIDQKEKNIEKTPKYKKVSTIAGMSALPQDTGELFPELKDIYRGVRENYIDPGLVAYDKLVGSYSDPIASKLMEKKSEDTKVKPGSYEEVANRSRLIAPETVTKLGTRILMDPTTYAGLYVALGQLALDLTKSDKPEVEEKGEKVYQSLKKLGVTGETVLPKLGIGKTLEQEEDEFNKAYPHLAKPTQNQAPENKTLEQEEDEFNKLYPHLSTNKIP